MTTQQHDGTAAPATTDGPTEAVPVHVEFVDDYDAARALQSSPWFKLHTYRVALSKTLADFNATVAHPLSALNGEHVNQVMQCSKSCALYVEIKTVKNDVVIKTDDGPTAAAVPSHRVCFKCIGDRHACVKASESTRDAIEQAVDDAVEAETKAAQAQLAHYERERAAVQEQHRAEVARLSAELYAARCAHLQSRLKTVGKLTQKVADAEDEAARVDAELSRARERRDGAVATLQSVRADVAAEPRSRWGAGVRMPRPKATVRSAGAIR